MKIILITLSLFINILVQAQKNYKIIEIPPLNTGIYGDEVKRIITAGSEGAEIRFIDPIFGTAIWNQDSLFNFIIEENKLDSSSSVYDIAFSVANFIKNGELEQHIQGFGISATIIDQDSNTVSFKNKFEEIINTPELNGDEFSMHFCDISNNIAKLLGIEIQVAINEINGHIFAEYYDNTTEKWVIVDVDPQSKLFMPQHNGNPLSIEELLNKPKLVFEDDHFKQMIYANQLDSIMTNRNYTELQSRISNTTNTKRQKIELRDLKFDHYYKLAPFQKLEWNYTLNALYLDKNQCVEEFVKLLPKFESGDSTTIVDALFQYSKCFDQDPMLIVPRIAGECALFADSTYFGKDNVRENTFTTNLIKGKYDTSKFYINHFIKSVNGKLSTETNYLEDGFELSLYDFSEDAPENERIIIDTLLKKMNTNFEVQSDSVEIQFYSNDKLNFIVNEASEIAIFQGDITVKNIVNNKEVAQINSIK